MTLTDEQLRFYNEQGYLLLPNHLSIDETNVLAAEGSKLITTERIGKVFEKDGASVRALHGSHAKSSKFNDLTRHPRLLTPAVQILNSEVYVYQFKLNTKAAFSGDKWPWHQDFIFWNQEDGMPTPQAVNIAIFIDEVTQFNGPLFLIPESHKRGTIRNEPKGQGWKASFSADLKYTVPHEHVTALVKQRDLFSATGSLGSVLLFHPNCVHASSNNISPFSRNIIVVTYNSVHNIPPVRENPRPKFLVSRNTKALEPLPENTLVGTNS